MIRRLLLVLILILASMWVGSVIGYQLGQDSVYEQSERLFTQAMQYYIEMENERQMWIDAYNGVKKGGLTIVIITENTTSEMEGPDFE